ncbi:PQQ-binding-like beta-propeller repeat protein [Streptomyces sp. NPDC005805]|uniref:outer membrane protein assembly factor BamB family protein n=1 Tax=Streptomyces sp. NPDC005805 TaxID=3157068 RepID=UPI0033CBDA7E
MRTWRSLTAVATAALLGGVLTACGGDGAKENADGRSGDKASPSATAKAPARKTFDPPVRFDAENETRLPDSLKLSPELGSIGFSTPTFALYEGLAYTVSEEKLSAYDTVGGETVWSAPVGRGQQRPYVVANGDGALVIAAVSVTTGGTGTSKATTSTEVVALDARTGTEKWRTAVGAEGDLIGADATAAVVAETETNADTETETGAVRALDPATGKELWQKQDAGLVDPVYSGGAVVGVVRSTEKFTAEGRSETFENRFTRLVGLSAKDGSKLWEQYAKSTTLKARAIGTGLLQVQAVYQSLSGDFGDDTEGVVDARTGKQLVRLPLREGTDANAWTCVYDERSVVVCGSTEHTSDEVNGYDAVSGKKLWSLPTGDRTSLEVTTAWHGAVYGEAKSGPVVLDARTGADRETAPGVAPSAVDGGVGLVKGNRGSLEAHLAVG